MRNHSVEIVLASFGQWRVVSDIGRSWHDSYMVCTHGGNSNYYQIPMLNAFHYCSDNGCSILRYVANKRDPAFNLDELAMAMQECRRIWVRNDAEFDISEELAEVQRDILRGAA